MGELLHVYILTNRSGTLYVGVTSDLHRRVHEHRTSGIDHFTGRYRLNRLIYVESTSDWRAALAREKQIKGWSRAKKLSLVNAVNPEWIDLLAPPGESCAPAPGPSLRSG